MIYLCKIGLGFRLNAYTLIKSAYWFYSESAISFGRSEGLYVNSFVGAVYSPAKDIIRSNVHKFHYALCLCIATNVFAKIFTYSAAIQRTELRYPGRYYVQLYC